MYYTVYTELLSFPQLPGPAMVRLSDMVIVSHSPLLCVCRFRKRFVQNAEKLHSCHNEYALALVNANIHIDHHKTSLLPFCLDTLQQRMELQITRW